MGKSRLYGALRYAGACAFSIADDAGFAKCLTASKHIACDWFNLVNVSDEVRPETAHPDFTALLGGIVFVCQSPLRFALDQEGVGLRTVRLGD